MTNKVGIIGLGVVGTAVGVVLSNKDMRLRVFMISYPNLQKYLWSGWLYHLFITSRSFSLSRYIVYNHIRYGHKGCSGRIVESGAFHSGQVVIHMSGSTSQVLDGARAFGAFVLSIHPLQSFADVDRAIANLQGSVFSIEGIGKHMP